MTRLLVVGPLPPPVGGVETVTRIVLDSPAFADFEMRHCDLTKHRPKDTQGKVDLGNLWWAGRHLGRMAGAVIRFRPHVVYMPLTATWSGFWRDVALAAIARAGGAKVVGHVHAGWFDRLLEAWGVRRLLVRIGLARFNGLLLLGRDWKQKVEAYGFKGKTFVVPSTFRAELYREAQTFTRDYESASPVGLFVGHVGRNKGVLDLLEAVARLRQTKARLVIVGPPQFAGDWTEVMQRWETLGLQSQVEFTGPLQGAELYRRFRDADYLVLPSYWEGLPVVFFEAGSFGLPVVGTPVGAVSELLRAEHNALLIGPGDVEALTAAIRRLQADSSLRRRLGMQLRQDIEAFHPEKVCARIAETIRETLEEKISMVQEDPKAG